MDDVVRCGYGLAGRFINHSLENQLPASGSSPC